MPKLVRVVPAKEGASLFVEAHLDTEVKGKELNTLFLKAIEHFNKLYKTNVKVDIHSSKWNIDHKNKPVFVVFSKDLEGESKASLLDSKRYKMEYIVSLYQDMIEENDENKLVPFESAKKTEQAFDLIGLDVEEGLGDLVNMLGAK